MRIVVAQCFPRADEGLQTFRFAEEYRGSHETEVTSWQSR
jgi:hypothetical protein